MRSPSGNSLARRLVQGLGVSSFFALGLLASGAQADVPLTAIALPDGEPAAPEAGNAAVRKELEALGPSVKPHLAADRRTAALLTEEEEALKATDRAARKVKLEALARRAIAIRTDALAKARVGTADLERRVQGIPIAPIGSLTAPPPPTPPGVLSTTNFTSFPLPYTAKKASCTQATWDFTGNKVTFNSGALPSVTTPKECEYGLNVGRSVRVTVPAEATKVKVIGTATVSLDCSAAAQGFYGASAAYWGVRVASTNGATLAHLGPAQQPVKVLSERMKRIHCMNVVPNPLLVDASSWDGDIQDGDQGSSAVFPLPKEVWGSQLEVSLFVGGKAESEIFGIASASGSITPKAAKVIFYK